MQKDELYMQRCIDLAKNGLGRTYPNPLVGSVVVYDGNIVGEGWHQKAGEPHAEVHAIKNVSDASVLSKSTLYVNLEPCSHFGKTPPCAHRIIEAGIPRVVIGTTDPNPAVAGKGIALLKEAGCEVSVGILQKECNALNKRFFTFQNKKRPFIILKWAQTADGFVAPATRDEQAPVWITNQLSQQRSHQLRATEQAILVGTQTAIDDNPSLTTRLWKGESPTRIALDKSLRISDKSALYDGSSKTIILTEQPGGDPKNICFETIDFSNEVASEVCRILYRYEIQSVIIEGGTQTLKTFINAGLWDEALVFQGKIAFTQGTKAPEFKGNIQNTVELKSDQLTHYKNPTS